MNFKKSILKIIGLLVLGFIIFSCEDTSIENDIEPTDNDEKMVFDTLSITNNFLFNVPFVADTFFIDKLYNIDIRIGLEGYFIDSVSIIDSKGSKFVGDTAIISSKYFCHYENPERIKFFIRTINQENKDTVFFESESLMFKAVESLAKRFVHSSVDEGRLKLIWQEFDENNTQKYLVERWIIDDNFNQNYGEKKYYHRFEVNSATFLDNYYVGEEAEYKITIINNENDKQDIWYYKKSKEHPKYYISQNSSGGYNLNFTKCKYFNNFGQYYLTDGYNFSPTFIRSTDQINDTTLNIADAEFGSEARFWLRYLPKQLPEGFTENDWYIYGKFIYARYGIKSFEYEGIAIINEENLAYTEDGNIYKFNISSNQKTDSIINKNARYGFLTATPAGNYLYAFDENIYGSPVYFWTTNKLSTNPDYSFQSGFAIPPVSDNLVALKSIPSNVSPSNLALYDVTTGNNIYTTDYSGSGNRPKISNDGQYFLIDNSGLKLCSYINNKFGLIWEESDWKKSYRFYDFNPQNDDQCYIWDDNKIFSIRKTSDFSAINSFTIEADAIVNIDYFSNKIMAYTTDKILIYNLNNGNLIKEIPANLSELFFSGNKTVLLGNTIYNNNGVLYKLNQ
ncbi:hypothetical protein [uncultured Draconibacterium sp.]|uniref:hypothetical protein n=1 Tax=uncultured Draconibacterium sp. TaxID=1573823 RepID=UPI003217733E